MGCRGLSHNVDHLDILDVSTRLQMRHELPEGVGLRLDGRVLRGRHDGVRATRTRHQVRAY